MNYKSLEKDEKPIYKYIFLCTIINSILLLSLITTLIYIYTNIHGFINKSSNIIGKIEYFEQIIVNTDISPKDAIKFTDSVKQVLESLSIIDIKHFISNANYLVSYMCNYANCP